MAIFPLGQNIPKSVVDFEAIIHTALPRQSESSCYIHRMDAVRLARPPPGVVERGRVWSRSPSARQTNPLAVET
jgi:hypothetical protein